MIIALIIMLMNVIEGLEIPTVWGKMIFFTTGFI